MTTTEKSDKHSNSHPRQGTVQGNTTPTKVSGIFTVKRVAWCAGGWSGVAVVGSLQYHPARHYPCLAPPVQEAMAGEVAGFTPEHEVHSSTRSRIRCSKYLVKWMWPWCDVVWCVVRRGLLVVSHYWLSKWNCQNSHAIQWKKTTLIRKKRRNWRVFP